jgi:ABC-type antimicrobial peptide transport system permease subunit
VRAAIVDSGSPGILGLVVVAIMRLVSALSIGVIERTREVGILRCVGARARQIRRVFSAEAVVLAAVGWAFGVLLGWLMYQGLLALGFLGPNSAGKTTTVWTLGTLIAPTCRTTCAGATPMPATPTPRLVCVASDLTRYDEHAL